MTRDERKVKVCKTKYRVAERINGLGTVSFTIEREEYDGSWSQVGVSLSLENARGQIAFLKDHSTVETIYHYD